MIPKNPKNPQIICTTSNKTILQQDPDKNKPDMQNDKVIALIKELRDKDFLK